MKTKTIPFDLETAERIQAGEIKGKIKTRNFGYECTIVKDCVYTGHTYREKLLLVRFPAHDFEEEKLKVYHYDGRYMSEEDGEMWFDLVLEVPEEAPEEQHLTEESELYQAGYKAGFEAGRCVAFDEKKKGRAIKKKHQSTSSK